MQITEIKSGTLFLNDEPIMTLSAEQLTSQSIEADNIPEKLTFTGSKEAEFTTTNTVNRNTLLSLLFGRKVTNNWLKKHGGVMTRKKGKKYDNTRKIR